MPQCTSVHKGRCILEHLLVSAQLDEGSLESSILLLEDMDVTMGLVGLIDLVTERLCTRSGHSFFFERKKHSLNKFQFLFLANPFLNKYT
jgi:hypothetical protein